VSNAKADLERQAGNQANVAGGMPIQWHVAEQAATHRMRTLLLPQIILIFEPPI
jgi:hypothetical protein